MAGYERRRNLQSIMAGGRGGRTGRKDGEEGEGSSLPPQSTHCVTIPRHASPTRPEEPRKQNIVL